MSLQAMQANPVTDSRSNVFSNRSCMEKPVISAALGSASAHTYMCAVAELCTSRYPHRLHEREFT